MDIEKRYGRPTVPSTVLLGFLRRAADAQVPSPKWWLVDRSLVQLRPPAHVPWHAGDLVALCSGSYALSH
jgi:hypothetical protein